MADIKGLKMLFDMTKGYFLTTVINQALPFLLLPILTRYLSTEEYGMLSLYSFYHVIAFAFVGSSLPTIVSKHFYEKEKIYISEIIGNCIWVSLTLSIFLEIFILISYCFFNEELSIPLIWLVLTPFVAVANVILSLGLTVCRNRKKVKHFGALQINNTLTNVLISLFLVCLMRFGWAGRASGIMISFIISAVITIIYLHKQDYLNLSFMMVKFKEVFTFGLQLIPNSLQLNLISQVGMFFMQIYFTKQLLGLYSLGFQLAFVVKLLVDTLQMSWSPFLFKQLAENEKMNKVFVTRMLIALIGILAVGAIAICLVADPVLWLMTTPEYFAASKYVPYFILGIFFYGIYTFVSPILYKFEQQKYIGNVSFISMIIMIISNILFAKLFDSMGIVYAYCFTYVTLSLSLIIKAQQHIKLPILKAMKLYN